MEIVRQIEAVTADGTYALEVGTLAMSGHTAHPGLAVPPEIVARQSHRILQNVSSDRLQGLRWEDLWFAWACLDGNPIALQHFDALLQDVVDGTIRRVDVERDELLQQARDSLLIGADADLTKYLGSGPLRRWLRTVLLRRAFRLAESRKKETHTMQLDDIAFHRLGFAEGDPERRYLVNNYAGALQTAFRCAFLDLSSRQRNVLYYHLVEGLSIDRIGAVYRVHRSTVANWLSAIRKRLYHQVRRHFCNLKGTDPWDMDSLLRIIKSQLELSLSVLEPSKSDLEPEQDSQRGKHELPE